MGSASHIVLTGESAGGIGVSPNVDWLAGRVPSATVIGAPIAGFYYYADPYTGPGHTQSGLADFREAAWPQHYQLWGSYVDTDCAASLKATPWACVLANNSWPYVSSKMFFTQSMTDKVVLEAHDWVPGPPSSWTAPVTNYVKEWSMNMTKGLGALISARNNDVGVFAAECVSRWLQRCRLSRPNALLLRSSSTPGSLPHSRRSTTSRIMGLSHPGWVGRPSMFWILVASCAIQLAQANRVPSSAVYRKTGPCRQISNYESRATQDHKLDGEHRLFLRSHATLPDGLGLLRE